LLDVEAVLGCPSPKIFEALFIMFQASSNWPSACNTEPICEQILAVDWCSKPKTSVRIESDLLSKASRVSPLA